MASGNFFFSLFFVLIDASIKSQAFGKSHGPSANCLAVWEGKHDDHYEQLIFNKTYTSILLYLSH
jgi:hypothetical protein